MNNNEFQCFIVIAILLAAVLITLIGCVTHYNLTNLKLQSSGQPLSTEMHIYKLDDKQFSQLVSLLKTGNVENSTSEEELKNK